MGDMSVVIMGIENELFNLVQEARHQIIRNKPLLAVEALGAMTDIMGGKYPSDGDSGLHEATDSEKA